MRIIERHDLVWPGARIACTKCTTVFEVDIADLDYHPSGGDQRDGWSAYVTVKCPVCERVNNVPTPPQWVIDAARDNPRNTTDRTTWSPR